MKCPPACPVWFESPQSHNPQTEISPPLGEGSVAFGNPETEITVKKCDLMLTMVCSELDLAAEYTCFRWDERRITTLRLKTTFRRERQICVLQKRLGGYDG